MNTYWSNTSCDPVTCDGVCESGFLPRYVVMATAVQDVQAAVRFAKLYNIRLVVRSSGSDMGGRSTGYGSLLVNVRGMKGIEWIKEYGESGHWKGGAVKIAAGVLTGELYLAANAQRPRVDVVGGEGPVS
jgi:FAD/FMN-containing dehydrogenase